MMEGKTMTGKDGGATLKIRFTATQLAAIDAWIARHDEPRPDRAEAVRQIVAGRLGTHLPSTVVPDLVTGRDIV